LIAARDMAIPAPAPLAQSVAFRERLLLAVMFVTTLTSSIAFVQPSPHDALLVVLALAALIAGARFERLLLVPFLLLLVFNVAGLMSLINVVGQDQTVLFASISVYLALAAMVWACVLAQDTLRRLTVMRIAYTISAVISALLGAAGYFHLFPHAFELFTDYGRAMAAFKDPNVYGPFLIWPALFALDRMVAQRVRFIDAMVLAILVFGLLLSFSRGAWFNFAAAGLLVVALNFLTAPTRRQRLRILVLSGAGVAAMVLFVVFLLSFHSIDRMFDIRAHLIQSYDVGQGGRFHLQELALGDVLKYPNGMGPFGFATVHGLQQHNVYLQAFLVYGWTGAMAYLLLLFATFTVGLRNAFVRTPWQPYAITAFAAFIGTALEGFVIDTDHWRHFFLLLGIIWGTAAATRRLVRARPAMAPA
jgi:O-Antigen ligase